MAAPFARRLQRLILAARAAIAWERLWPALAPLVGVLVLFAATAWMGLWIGLSPAARVGGLALFVALLAAATVPLFRLRLPAREDALRRLEAEAALDHRPLGAYEDTLAAGQDPVAAALWRVHRQRAEARLSALRVPVPRADLVPHDPYALRAVVGMVAFIGVLVGAGALAERLLTPFDFSDPVEAAVAAPFRLDAWVTPPAYTGRAPLFLSAATQVETADGIRVPAGSVLTVRTHGVSGADLYVSGVEGAGPRTMTPVGGTDGVVAAEGTVTLDAPMAVEVRRDGVTLDGWQFVTDADTPPTIRLTEAPRPGARDTVEFRYEIGDDYGVTAAEGRLTPEDAPEGRRPLVEDPTFALTLPGGAGLTGAARTVQDLSAHPYAGRTVVARLSATDGVGQRAESEPTPFRLPARPFTNPMARAVVEQRGLLAMDAEAHLNVIEAFDLLLLQPEEVGTPGAYLAVRAAYGGLVAAETDDELRAMLDALWDLALLLEDDGLTDAERALRAAEQRLRQALEDGASEEEIARLTAELRQAMQEYMQALAERMQNAPPQAMDPNAQQLSQQDLDEMLNRIEELARQGRHEEAEQLLSELQQMMQNLQMAQPGQGGPSQEQQTLDELGQMIQRQQELMDETYGLEGGEQQGRGQQPGNEGRFGRSPQGQGQGQQGQQGQGQPGGEGQPGGMSPSERAEALGRLQEQQRALQEQLAELMQRLEDQGFDPGERLGDAEGSMGDAGEALGQSRPGDAVGNQGEALQALREGAQGMAQQMAEANQPGGPGGGEQRGAPMPGPPQDPLGRARREGSVADTSRVEIPDEVDTQAARRILQELRDRLGDRALPRLERDYLERLLP